MRQQDELSMRQRAQDEARQWGRAEAAAAAQESEEESDSEDERSQGQQQGAAPGGGGSAEQHQAQQAGDSSDGDGQAGPESAGFGGAGAAGEGPSYIRIPPEEQHENGGLGGRASSGGVREGPSMDASLQGAAADLSPRQTPKVPIQLSCQATRGFPRLQLRPFWTS